MSVQFNLRFLELHVLNPQCASPICSKWQIIFQGNLNISQRLRLLNPLRGIYEQQGSIASGKTFVTPRTKNQYGKASSHGVKDVIKREERLQTIRKATQIWEFDPPERVLAKVEIVNLPVFFASVQHKCRFNEENLLFRLSTT
jgi:hypothetical protein